MIRTALPHSPREVQGYLAQAYAHQRGLGGMLTRWRPYICPFEELLARVPTGASVLDLGCGSGIMSSLVAQFAQPRRVLGIDISPRSIGVAQASDAARSGAAEFEVLPPFAFPEEHFDVVLCVDVLHHVPPARQWEFLERALSCLRPGGRLLFKDISPRPWWKAQANRLHDLLLARQWVHYRHESEVREQLAAQSGQTREAARLDRLWYSHYLLVWDKAD